MAARPLEEPTYVAACGIGFGGGQCLSLVDYVTVIEPARIGRPVPEDVRVAYAASASGKRNGWLSDSGGQGSRSARLTMPARYLALVVVLIVSLATVAHTQPSKTARVGVLASSTEANFGPNVKTFREALRAAGWVEGRNLTLDVRYAGEQYGRLPELAADLVRLDVDVLVSLGIPRPWLPGARRRPFPS